MKILGWLKRKPGASSEYFEPSGCVSTLGFAHYLHGGVEMDPARAPLEEHMAGCAACREHLAFLIRTLSENEPLNEPLMEETAPAATPAEVERYTNFILSRQKKSGVWARVEPALARMFPTAASRRLAYASGLVLAIVLAGTWAWMRSTRGRQEALYAQGLESLKSAARLETASGLRLAGAPAEPRETWQSPSPGRLGALDQALIYFGQVLALKPHHVEARIRLGQVYLLKQSPAEAQNQFQEVLNQDPGHAGALTGLGTALFEQAMLEQDLHKRDERLRAAREAFRKVLAADPRALEALYNQALVCYELGDKAKTLEAIEKYLALDPKSRWAERLSMIRDQLRLSSYSIFHEAVEEAFRHRQWDRLAYLVSHSARGAWLIKKSLRLGLKREVEGQGDEAAQAYRLAEAVETAYRQFTGVAHYRPLLDFYRRFSPEQKRQKYQAIGWEEEAFARYQEGEHEASLRAGERALAIDRKLQDDWDTAYIHNLRGNSYFYRRSDYDRALAAYEAAARAARAVEDHDELARALGNRAVIDQALGNYSDMKAHLDRMLLSAEKARDTVQQAVAFNYFGNLYRELGDWEESVRYYGQALRLNCQMGDQTGQLENLEHISLLYQQHKQYEPSIGFL